MTVNQSHTFDELKVKGLFKEDLFWLNWLISQIKRIISAPLKSTFIAHLGWLIYRELLNTHRDINNLIGRFGVTIFSHYYWASYSKALDLKTILFPAIFNSVWDGYICTIMSKLGAAQPVMLTFPFERLMFMRGNLLLHYISTLNNQIHFHL